MGDEQQSTCMPPNVPASQPSHLRKQLDGAREGGGAAAEDGAPRAPHNRAHRRGALRGQALRAGGRRGGGGAMSRSVGKLWPR